MKKDKKIKKVFIRFNNFNTKKVYYKYCFKAEKC